MNTQVNSVYVCEFGEEHFRVYHFVNMDATQLYYCKWLHQQIWSAIHMTSSTVITMTSSQDVCLSVRVSVTHHDTVNFLSAVRTAYAYWLCQRHARASNIPVRATRTQRFGRLGTRLNGRNMRSSSPVLPLGSRLQDSAGDDDSQVEESRKRAGRGGRGKDVAGECLWLRFLLVSQTSPLVPQHRSLAVSARGSLV